MLFGKPRGKKPLGRPRRRREDNIKMDLKAKWFKNWISDRIQWHIVVNTVMVSTYNSTSLHGITTQKTNIDIFTAVKTSDRTVMKFWVK
jgi:hypothetical protein